MAEVAATIRPYVHPDDDKLVRWMVGKSSMEPLAIANRTASTHPTVIAVWILISCIFVEYMHWWPSADIGYMSYLRPLPAFAVLALPIVFTLDLLNRPTFDEESVQVLKRPDIVDRQTYYSRSPASGIWIFEYGKKFVGIVAVDASNDSLSLKTVDQGTETPSNRAAKYSKGTASVASIRHLYIDEQYRPASAENDLIKFAVKHTFEASPTVESIRITPSPLYKYLSPALKAEGFVVIERGAKVGVFRWTTLTYELTRERWNSRRSS